jgi:ABC-type multidrug transport system permease subunit
MWLGFAIGMLTLFFVIGTGLLISANSKTEQVANSTGTMASVILGFLSGSFLQLPRIEIGEIFGQVRQIWDILPSFHANQALQQVLTYGKGFDAIWQNLLYMTVVGLIIFAFGVAMFSKKQLRAE